MALDIKKFTEDCLKASNDYRARHGAGPLKINKELSVMAQKWAEELVKRGTMAHSGDSYNGKPVGENVFQKWTSDGRVIQASEAVNSWYSEVTNYNFETSEGKHTGHFTQLVWKSSTEVGIGRAVSADGKSCFVVNNYSPAGNIRGKFPENVLKASGGGIKDNPDKAKAANEEKPRQSFLDRLFGKNNSNSSSPENKSTTVISEQKHAPTNQPGGTRVLHVQPNPAYRPELDVRTASYNNVYKDVKVVKESCRIEPRKEEFYREMRSSSPGGQVVTSLFRSQVTHGPDSTTGRSYQVSQTSQGPGSKTTRSYNVTETIQGPGSSNSSCRWQNNERTVTSVVVNRKQQQVITQKF